MVTHITPVTVTDTNTGAVMRTHDFGAVPAVDLGSGQLYVVWQDGRFTGGKFAQILLTTSTDGGQNWSTPKVVSGGPATTHAFNPGIAVGADHTVGIYYYDFRNLQAGNTSTLSTDVWFRKAPGGGNTTFGSETRVSDTSFNMLATPNAFGFFLGDYNGVVATGTSFHLCSTRPTAATTAAPLRPTRQPAHPTRTTRTPPSSN